MQPATSPRIATALLRAATASPSEGLVLLLEEPVPATQLPQFRGLAHRCSRTVAVLDIGLTQPVLQTGLADPEVRSDLPDRDAVVALTGHSHDIVAELTGMGLGHDDSLSTGTTWHHKSVVTYPCSSPELDAVAPASSDRPESAPSLLNVARAGKWLKVDAKPVYR